MTKIFLRYFNLKSCMRVSLFKRSRQTCIAMFGYIAIFGFRGLFKLTDDVLDSFDIHTLLEKYPLCHINWTIERLVYFEWVRFWTWSNNFLVTTHWLFTPISIMYFKPKNV